MGNIVVTKKDLYSIQQGSYLAHHGILGERWGIRRYQNPDGSLTAAGRERYSVGQPDSTTISKSVRERFLQKCLKFRIKSIQFCKHQKRL